MPTRGPFTAGAGKIANRTSMVGPRGSSCARGTVSERHVKPGSSTHGAAPRSASFSAVVDDVAGAYDAWAAVYDTDGNPLVAIDSSVVPSIYARSVRGKRALDVGCGTGRHTALLVEAGAAAVVGVDASSGMLARARERVGD